jgi:hypothetical protein
VLGKLPDAEVARRIGRTVQAVRIKREKMGLPNSESRVWTGEELSQLGTATDAKLASRLVRTTSAVTEKGIALGISAARATTRGGNARPRHSARGWENGKPNKITRIVHWTTR